MICGAVMELAYARKCHGTRTSSEEDVDSSAATNGRSTRPQSQEPASRTKAARDQAQRVTKRPNRLPSPHHNCHESGRAAAANGWPPMQRFMDSRTDPITKRSFCLLLTDGGIEKNVIRRYFNVDLKRWSPEDALLIESVSNKLHESLRLMGERNEQATMRYNIRDFHDRNWITRESLYSDFNTVINVAFADGQLNWGRFISFMLIAASFAGYMIERDMEDAAESVQAWTVLTLREKMAPLFLEQGSWVSQIVHVLCVCVLSLQRRYFKSMLRV